MRSFFLFVLVSIGFNQAIAQSIKVQPYWQQLKTEAYKGKQDDIFFLNDSLGWYVNGSGKIYKTRNSGRDWALMIEKPGTYFRCIGFADSLNGFAGNIGTDYFPNVSDTIPLYRTTDGGRSWLPVKYSGPTVKGLCAIDIYKEAFVNAGKLDYRTHVFAGGRVGSPAFLMISHDGGTSFSSMDMSKYCSYILDVKFFSLKEGVICAASGEELDKTHALILTTADGGKTWEKRYESKRPYEITWKCSFPGRNTGYVTVQSYDTSRTASQRYVAKTTDGGKTWKEIPLVKDKGVREFGIAFTDDSNGWVGAMPQGFVTHDGGRTWEKSYMGAATNKIRVVKNPAGTTAYAIGVTVAKSKDYLSDGNDVIAAMRDHYAGGKWYKNLTFTQDAIFYKDGKEVKKEQWHEALQSPGNLIIKMDSMNSSNGVLFSDKKVFNIKDGKASEPRPFIHDLLLVGFDPYFLKPYETAHLLDSLGYDLKQLHEDVFEGRKVYVVGAAKGDEKSNQFWIDAERWYMHRIIYKKRGQVQDVVFADYTNMNNNWVAQKVIFKANGVLQLEEKYYNIRFPKELSPDLFQPEKFMEAKW